MAAQAQNARSSSVVRLRRLPVARSSAQTLAAALLVAARARVCPAAVMTSPGLAAAGGLQQRGCVGVLLGGAADQDRQDREPFAGPGVHPRLAVPLGLALDGLGGADRAGGDPACPPGRVLDGPLGQVEVEGPDRGQELAVADPLGVDHGLGAVGRGDGLGLGPHPLLPRVGDLGAQVQAVDAGMVGFQVGPEHAQPAGQLFQAGVVHRGLAFLQVVDQQVADRPAGQVVPVDHLLGGALARGAQLPQPRRRGRAEDPHLAQQPVAGGGPGSGGAEHVGLGVQQLQDVADRDAGEHPALGGHDHRGPAQRVTCGRSSAPGRRARRRTGPRAARSPAGHGMRPWPGPAQRRIRRLTSQARDGRTMSAPIGGDQRRAAARQPARPGTPAAACSQPGGQLPPGGPGGLGAAGQPALLPAVAVLVLQPVQQQAPPAG